MPLSPYSYGSVASLDQIGDVVITTPTVGQVVKHDGTKWVNGPDEGGVGGSAPADATYIVATANATLTAERVVTNTTNFVWDTGTAGQLKGNVQFAGSGSAATASKSDHDHSGTYLPTATKLDDLSTPDDNTDLNATTGVHGLLPKLGGGTTNYLRADGTWAAPAGGSATNAFGTIAVSGQSDVVAEAAPDTLTLVAGSNITLTTNASTDTITIASSGGGAAALDDLSDVIITTPSDNQFLRHNGTNWVNETVSLVGSGDMLASTYDPATIAQQLVGTTATQTVENKRLKDTATITQTPTPSAIDLNNGNVIIYTMTADTTFNITAGVQTVGNAQSVEFWLTGNFTPTFQVAGGAVTFANGTPGAQTGGSTYVYVIKINGAASIIGFNNIARFTSTVDGLAPLSGGGTTNYLRADGTWAAPPGGAASNSFETIVVAGQSNVVADSGTDTLTLVAGSNITLTTNASTDTVTIASSGGGAAALDDLSDVIITTPSDDQFLRHNGTNWVNETVSIGGDVTAAAAFATDNRVIRSDGTGKGVQASAITITDAGAISGAVFARTFAEPTIGASITLTLNASNECILNQAGHTVNIPPPADNSTEVTTILRAIQDGTGSRTVTTWQNTGAVGTVAWVGGSAPTLKTAANAWDLIAFASRKNSGGTVVTVATLVGSSS